MLYVAGLQSIDKSLLEAAEMDGADAFRRFWHITLPLLGPMIRLSIFFSVVGAMQFFDFIVPLTGGGPWICAREKHWVFAGTGMKDGDRVPGLVGWEWHGLPAPVPGLEVVATGPARRGDSEIIAEHLKMLSKKKELRKLYELLSESISELHGMRL